MRFNFILSRKNLISKQYSLTQQQHQHNQIRTFLDSTIKLVRDRGLDHAVEREKNLHPLINLKNFIINEPSKSIPLSVIAEKRDLLKIPIRPIEFIRKYPAVFEEFLPGGIGIQPHIKLTTEVLNLDADEQLMYQSDSYKQQVADRLLKLLMISRIHKIPLRIIEHLKWDLGLPQDYVQSLIPDFPDYFQIVGGKDRKFGLGDEPALELVCWSNELAISVMEKKFKNGNLGSAKDEPLAFPLQFSTGFEIDKKYKKWLDDWQKLPYISPYENAAHLPAKSDESDKWAVAVLHEVLHILVPKKTDRENMLLLGEYLGLRSRFKRALLQHPGIFYISSKIGTYTVVLREAYKRGSLTEPHPLMTLRSQYIHLINTVKEDGNTSKVQGKSAQQDTKAKESEGKKEDDINRGEEQGGKQYDSSDAESEDASDNDYDDDDDEQPQRRKRKSPANNRDGTARKMNLVVKRPLRNSRREGSTGKLRLRTNGRAPSESEFFKRREMQGGYKEVDGYPQRSKIT